MTTSPATPLAIFESLRPRLFGIAYRMLGTVEDAEDTVQESFVRWHAAKLETIVSAEAWLVSVVTRLSIDRLRRVATERANYVGEWLPEPIASAPDHVTDRRAELASDLSLAFMVLLERLGPEERAAFLLREVWNADYREIAEVLGKSEAACRQLVHRARDRVRGDRVRVAAPPDAKERLVERFVDALARDDRDALLALFSDDVIFVADGGGKSPSIREAMSGAELVAKLLTGFERMGRGLVRHQIGPLNGEPAILTLVGDLTFCTTSFAIDDGRITAIYRVLNPDKLRHVGPEPLEERTLEAARDAAARHTAESRGGG